MKTVCKIATGVLVASLILIGGCVALIGAGVDEAQKESDKTAITPAQYQSIKTGTKRSTVEAKLGEPQSRNEFSTEIEGLGDEPIGSECIYYGKQGEMLSLYQFCFDINTGKLESKSAF
jgi:hypothetical protein